MLFKDLFDVDFWDNGVATTATMARGRCSRTRCYFVLGCTSPDLPVPGTNMEKYVNIGTHPLSNTERETGERRERLVRARSRTWLGTGRYNDPHPRKTFPGCFSNGMRIDSRGIVCVRIFPFFLSLPLALFLFLFHPLVFHFISFSPLLAVVSMLVVTIAFVMVLIRDPLCCCFDCCCTDCGGIGDSRWFFCSINFIVPIASGILIAGERRNDGDLRMVWYTWR